MFVHKIRDFSIQASPGRSDYSPPEGLRVRVSRSPQTRITGTDGCTDSMRGTIRARLVRNAAMMVRTAGGREIPNHQADGYCLIADASLGKWIPKPIVPQRFSEIAILHTYPKLDKIRV